MRTLLLGLAAPLAAVAIPAAPAAALDPNAPQFTAGAAAGVTVHRGAHRGGPERFDRGLRRGDHDGDRRRDRGFDGFVFLGEREWHGDSAWRANSYNDWWHERPHRAYPRWVRSNDDCERVWQGGGAWRCEW